MSKINVTYTSDMMTNYVQAELIAPQDKFEALQSSDGHSLLFSVATDGVLYLIEEQSGATAAGWTKTDLSSALLARDFAGTKGAGLRTFDAGQSVADGSLGLAMVVGTGDGDALYLCLGNSNRDLSWAQAPNWTAYPYDAVAKAPAKLEIVNVFFTETTQSTQYIVVDLVRNPDDTVQQVARYYIDPTASSGRHWVSHDLPIDVQVDSYTSCVGRHEKGFYDGLYTAGHEGDSGQLVFRPLINAFGDGPPLPVRLALPGGAVPAAMAATRNQDLSTDLFVVSGKSLHYFAAANQKDGATAATLLEHEILSDSSELAAMAHDGVVTLWGRNASDQVFYLSAPAAQVATPGAWNTPVPVLSGIEKMSPYLNAVDGGNTIFAAGAGRLEKITQDPGSASKLWRTTQITLPAPPKQKSTSFNSYTTTIQLTGEDDLPLKGVALSVSASARSAVFINGLYYVVDKTPVHVASNGLGSVTIVEATGSLSGTTFSVGTGAGAALSINPMDKPFKKLATLDSVDKLKGAKVPKGSAGGGKGSGDQALVASGTSDKDLRTVAQGMQQLAQSYNGVKPTPSAAPRAQVLAAAAAPAALAASQPQGFEDAIKVAAGDLFNWLKSGVEAVVEVVKDAAGDVWHFIARIAGKVYSALLDTVEAVVGAVEWVFNAIKTGIEALIKFIEFLFEWDDIKRTKEIFENLTRLWLNQQVDDILKVEKQLDAKIAEAEKAIGKLTGVTDWSPLGTPATKPATGSAANPAKGQTSGSQLLSQHYHDNARSLTVTGKTPEPGLLQALIDDLITALKQEAGVLNSVLEEIQQLAQDFPTLTVAQVLERLVEILVDGLLSSVQVVIDAMLKILYAVAKEAVALLNTKIHIPVISDILNAIGIPDFSFLDLFCWIPAVAYTVVYKIAEGKAPFPKGSDSDLLINAKSLDQLQNAFGPAGQGSAGAALVKLPESAQTAVFVAGHAIAGFTAFVSDFVATFEAAEESGENPFAIPSAVLGVIQAGSVGVANFLVPRDPIKDSAVAYVSYVTTGSVILFKIIYSGPAQKKFGGAEGALKALAAEDGRATGAVVNAVLIVPALFATAWHFAELAEEKAGKERSDAIIEEVSNLSSYISRFSYAVAVNVQDEKVKAVSIAAMAVANLAYAGLQTAEALVD